MCHLFAITLKILNWLQERCDVDDNAKELLARLGKAFKRADRNYGSGGKLSSHIKLPKNPAPKKEAIAKTTSLSKRTDNPDAYQKPKLLSFGFRMPWSKPLALIDKFEDELDKVEKENARKQYKIRRKAKIKKELKAALIEVAIYYTKTNPLEDFRLLAEELKQISPDIWYDVWANGRDDIEYFSDVYEELDAISLKSKSLTEVAKTTYEITSLGYMLRPRYVLMAAKIIQSNNGEIAVNYSELKHQLAGQKVSTNPRMAIDLAAYGNSGLSGKVYDFVESFVKEIKYLPINNVEADIYLRYAILKSQDFSNDEKILVKVVIQKLLDNQESLYINSLLNGEKLHINYGLHKEYADAKKHFDETIEWRGLMQKFSAFTPKKV
jgi:hypothetical protein